VRYTASISEHDPPTCNGLRQVTQTVDPLNRVTGYGYCDCGSPEYVTNAFGTSLQEVTHYVYDQQGRRTHTYLPDGSSVTNTYDLLGRLTVVGDAVGRTTNTFDNLNRLVAVSNAVGRVQAITYDLEDRPVTVTDANGVTVTSTFDDLGRLRTRTYPDTGVEAFGYTVKGLVAYTNQIGKVTLFDYDTALRKTAETNANLEVVRYQYRIRVPNPV
jgi:YD repeat-containing protein